MTVRSIFINPLRNKSSLALFAASLLLIHPASARTWTSSDGSKTFDGELVAYDAETGSVSVELVNGQNITFKQEVLSPADIQFLKEKGTVVAATTTSSSSSSSGSGIAKSVPDELPDPDGKPADMSKPVQVFILMGQSNMLGFGKITGGEGSLENAVKTKNKYPYLIDDAGEWTERMDVRNVRVMNGQQFNNEWMKITGGNIGPEIGIGHYLGHAIDAPVMVLKSCIGNRSLGWDLLPPGSKSYEFNGKTYPGYRGTPEDPVGNGEIPDAGWYAGKQYDDDIASAKAVLDDLNNHYPDAKSYEVAGFFWWQGDKDMRKPEHFERYELNLIQFIKALRKEFNAPDAKFVSASLGQTSKGSKKGDGKILDAMEAVSKSNDPELKGDVGFVYSHPLSMGGSSSGHYSGNAETYMNVGEAMGKAMVELLK